MSRGIVEEKLALISPRLWKLEPFLYSAAFDGIKLHNPKEAKYE